MGIEKQEKMKPLLHEGGVCPESSAVDPASQVESRKLQIISDTISMG
jgi:hypothetical protein